MDKLKVFAVILLLVLVGYNIFTGATVQKVGIPGLFEIEFGPRRSEPPTDSRPPDGNDGNRPSGQQPDSNSQSSQARSTSGNWSGNIGELELIVTKVEAIRQVGDEDILRFYITVNNQTNDSITLPLFKNFSAIDSSGRSYQADQQISDWPDTFPPGTRVSASIDLEDSVPLGVSPMNISFGAIFGSLDYVGKSISVNGISTPQ